MIKSVMKNKSSVCSWWKILISFLLIGVMASMFTGGVRSYLLYKKTAQPDLQLNLATLHFFTKEYLKRRYFSLWVNQPPQKTQLPSFHIFSDDQSLESLDSDLPASGKVRYIQGHIQLEDPSMASEIQFRYRGGLPLHWLYKKKSFRVKLPPFITYRGERQFNLVNPSTLHTVTDWISYDMARSLGVLTPEYFPVRLYINKETNGLHYYLSRIDESFLRKNRRMPGSIYSGDTIYFPNPFGADRDGISEATFKDKDGQSLMWVDARLWEKDAARNAESEADRADIDKFIEVINLTDTAEFMKLFNDYFDKEKFYQYWALDTLTGSYHHDNFHNHKMYFDPYKGKFEPIEWDLRFWSSIFKTKDLPLYPLLRQVKLNPILEYERDQITYKLMQRFSVAEVIKRIDQANKAIKPELAADPLRQQPDSRFGRFKLDKEVPFSMDEYDAAIEELKLIYESRHRFLQSVYDESFASYTLESSSEDSVVISIAVTGNSPVELDIRELKTRIASQVEIKRIYQNKAIDLPENKVERLYPGRKILKGNVTGRADNWSILAFGKDRIEPSPLHYKYLMKGIGLSSFGNLNALKLTNAITGANIPLQLKNELPSAKDTVTAHPWSLANPQVLPIKEVVLSGEIIITEDQVFEAEQVVKILPGTTFKIAEGRSLVFYTKVLAEGTKASPILFLQLNSGKPWGSVVIQGKAANGSRLRNIKVTGGSVTKQRLISYPGQLNIHDVAGFQLEECLISENLVGDDSLHVAYSSGLINRCHFEKTAFDALDMDISDVTVSNSQFYQIGNDALDLMTSKVTIKDVYIEETGDKCISAGEESELLVFNTQFHRCFIGIAVKDQSKVSLNEVEFIAIKETPIALYQKNARYGAGGTITGDKIYGISKKDIDLQGNSVDLIPEASFFPLEKSQKKNHAVLKAAY